MFGNSITWKGDALKLAQDFPDMSWRKIASTLGIPKSTVSDFLRKELKDNKMDMKTSQGYLSIPKILIIDIETSTLDLQAFSIWNINANLEQIKRDWNILSFAAKWYGTPEDEVFYEDVRESGNYADDSKLLVKIWELIDAADFVVCHNASFDTKKINSRFLLNGMSKPSPYRVIDTLTIAKRNFGFTSNKLAYLTDKLCVKYKKQSHEEFAGISLWIECLKGNEDAWRTMMTYNIFDVLSLEELLTILAPWESALPNLSLYSEEALEELAEGFGDEWEECGYHYTNLSKFKRYRNRITGQFKRGRDNLIPKESRKNILTNIV